MKKLLILLALLPTAAYAADDPLKCHKKGKGVTCDVLKDKVRLDSITVNGGECVVPKDSKIFKKTYKAGEDFSFVPMEDGTGLLPATEECLYVTIAKVKFHGGKSQKVNNL